MTLMPPKKSPVIVARKRRLVSCTIQSGQVRLSFALNHQPIKLQIDLIIKLDRGNFPPEVSHQKLCMGINRV
jgi:hypothetical protein